MKKFTGILILALLLFASCNTSKYYFNMRGFGKAKKSLEKVMEDSKETSMNKEIAKDSVSLFLHEEENEIVKEEIVSEVNPENISSQTEVKIQPIEKKRNQSLKPEVRKNGISHLSDSRSKKKLHRSTQERNRNQNSAFDWEEFFEISMEILISLILIAAGLAMEGTLTFATFMATVLGALIGAVLFGFLLWLLFHNFFDGLRESRSRR